MTKSILITGCSSGIGLDAARTLTARGWQVFASCRKPEDCARLKAEGLVSPRLDYEDRASFAPALEMVLAATGGTLDALFHNGAFAIPAPLEDVPAEAMDVAFQANFLGWHALTREVLPVMRRQGHGRIVLNSSVLGFIGMKYRGAYCATKFALEGWADVLRLEMAPENIHVSLIEPGPIDTDFRKNAIRAFERWIDWEASPRAEEYRATLLHKLYEGSEGNRFELPAAAVTDKLLHAIEAPRPRPRYFVTKPTHAMGALKRLLTTRALDRIVSRG
ncbi:Short-chain dehydrogenase [Roseivivax lentus]|uniref:Short-chain dehydrogenase n=1 Tax=Roseivivax lentus TaxID=633194 RepID=A0A1N7M5U3_9RHOB|nr:SDR family NAD(P)-dependent oxidoreductase [Roseivivax lentus]SIS81458.1 Short-chain dehydrogenase [Roseivivax lentus]